jgi:hypothetical protein
VTLFHGPQPIGFALFLVAAFVLVAVVTYLIERKSSPTYRFHDTKRARR